MRARRLKVFGGLVFFCSLDLFERQPLSNYGVGFVFAISPAGCRGRAAGVMLGVPANWIVCDRLSRRRARSLAILK